PTKRVGRKLLISIHDSEVADEDLRELIALLQRYNVDKRQLAQFVSEKNAAWFRDDPATYWHEDVFKSASS
ncbi:hypothetical protein, partial [Salmonella enterica]|uniref:hypothetical protein n=1 Tax=Salmonella enterica TaxID=28901 RepID=UPI003CE98F4F